MYEFNSELLKMSQKIVRYPTVNIHMNTDTTQPVIQLLALCTNPFVVLGVMHGGF